MQKGNPSIGFSKHRKSGNSVNSQHFTGKKGGKKRNRKRKGINRKQMKLKRGSHKNKYESKNQP